MGYIFDALNRADGKQPVRPAPDATQTPAPAQAPAPPPPAQAPIAAPLAQTSLVLSGDEEIDAAPAPAPVQAAPPQPIPISSAQKQPATEPLGAIRPESNGNPEVDDRLVALTQPSSVMAEEYRSIRTGIVARWQNRKNLIHTITSATPQEGKTITSLNLGISFSELRMRRTIVVEADLRLPQFQKLLSLPEGPGLIGYLEGKARLEDTIHDVGDNRLHVIAAGGRVTDQAVQLLSGAAMASLLQTLRKKIYDHVIIDTPPVVELADAGILGALSDDVLMVVRMSRTPRGLVEQAMRALTSYNAPVAGLIATDQRRRWGRYYHYSRYGYSYRNYIKQAA